MPVHQLFPEPVYFSKLKRPLTKKELKTVNEYKKKIRKNVGNNQTNNKYVLEHETLKDLKEDLTKMVMDYFGKIVCTDNSITPYITQSWLNFTDTDEYHHHHSHPNSYVSGVLYIDAIKNVDKIKFYKWKHEAYELEIAQYNIFNSASWWYHVEKGDVVLFPSFLMHGVDNKKGTSTRISLAFNVFFRGKIGNAEKSTGLTIK